MNDHATVANTESRASNPQMCAQLRRRDPIRLDMLVSYAAGADRRGHPGKAIRYAHAHGVSRTRASRALNGSDPYSPGAKHLVYVEELRRNADPWPHVTEVISVAMQSVEDLSYAELCALLERLDDEEDVHEASENRSTRKAAVDPTPEQLEEAAICEIREIEIGLQRVCIRREIAYRKRMGLV